MKCWPPFSLSSRVASWFIVVTGTRKNNAHGPFVYRKARGRNQSLVKGNYLPEHGTCQWLFPLLVQSSTTYLFLIEIVFDFMQTQPVRTIDISHAQEDSCLSPVIG